MCTVVFIPNKGSFFIASLRDEHPNRTKAVLPILSKSNVRKYIAPIDPQGGGTWVGINNLGATIVLLNGGFVNHIKKESYEKSRGLIVTEMLSVDHPIKNWESLGLENVEPFTLVLWMDNKLTNLVWDGKSKYQTDLDSTKAHIWSSSTLYDVVARKERQIKFQKWMESSIEINTTSILEFFKNSNDESESLFIKNNDEIKTHSYTCIEIDKGTKHTISYQDLITETITSYSIS
jgi:uncharacterized protein with NRDE domain